MDTKRDKDQYTGEETAARRDAALKRMPAIPIDSIPERVAPKLRRRRQDGAKQEDERAAHESGAYVEFTDKGAELFA
jgi:hypothetical protein